MEKSAQSEHGQYVRGWHDDLLSGCLRVDPECEFKMLNEILRHLTTTRFRDLAGTRINTVVPLSEAFVNELVTSTLPASAPVRSLTIQPEAGDHFSVRIVAKAALIPPITLKLAIEQQPRVPGSAVLTLKMVTLGGLFGLASGAIAGFLPPAVRLEGERIFVDLRELAARRGASEAFDYLTNLQIHTDAGRVVLHVDAAVAGG